MNFDVLMIKNTTIITRDDNYKPKNKKKKSNPNKTIFSIFNNNLLYF